MKSDAAQSRVWLSISLLVGVVVTAGGGIACWVRAFGTATSHPLRAFGLGLMLFGGMAYLLIETIRRRSSEGEKADEVEEPSGETASDDAADELEEPSGETASEDAADAGERPEGETGETSETEVGDEPDEEPPADGE